MGIALDEMETTISFSRTGAHAEVWTSDTTMHTRFDRLCKESPAMYTCTDEARNRNGELLSKTYRIADKSMLTFRTKKKSFVLTEEEKAERAKRFEKVRNG
jgi:hypothetical protein